jgi:hypothetical protein
MVAVFAIPRQARELISGPCLGTKVRVLSFNMTQSRITGLLTRHNTLKRHLYLMGLSDSPLCRCGADDETSAHVFCECEALASLRHAYLGSLSLEPEYIKNVNSGGHLELWQGNRTSINQNGAHRARQLRPRCITAARSQT